MGTAGRRKRGRQTENCSLIYYTRRGKKISLAPSSHMEWGHTRTHGISLHLCTQGVRAARHTQESHGGSASPRERAREGGSPNNITTIHEEFTCRQKSRHRRTRGTTRDAHTTGLLLRRLASHVPHITTNRRWERKNEEKKKKNDNSARQPQERCCPATAPLLLLPGVFLVTPPRLFVVVTTGTARHTQHHPHSTSTRTHEGRASGDVLRAPRVATAQRALPPRLRRALGGLREQLLEQAFALVAAGLVINPGCGLLRRWGVRGRQQREEGRCRLRGPAP